MNGMTGGSVVLLSGGIDSTVCLTLAARSGPAPLALAFDYGQRNHVELDQAARIAQRFESEFVVVPIELSRVAPGGLTDGTRGNDPSTPTYVPARNLVFLSIAVAIAEARDLDRVYLGATASDHHHPDCTPAFLDAFAVAANAGLRRSAQGRPVRVRTPLLGLTKSAVIIAGIHYGAPLELTWSCYDRGTQPCGTCPACDLRALSFADIGIADPAAGHERTAGGTA